MGPVTLDVILFWRVAAVFFEDLMRTMSTTRKMLFFASFSKSRNLEDMAQFPSNFSVIKLIKNV